ncbi:MAG: NAD-dependent epimerase/dehydratase family protein [Actinobacteria bacterium]|nr:NAD-dependent epimerase/dehydratase family protein [Actinomycetota bacterium]
MRALVTGVAGFIGHHLAARLLADGWEVVGCDNFLTSRVENVPPGVRFAACSVQTFESEAARREISPSFDAVFHLAAMARVHVSFDRPGECLTNNIDSTIAALEIVRTYGGAFVYASSSSVYGSQDVTPFHEDMELRPQSPYALSKRIGEELCAEYATAFGVRYAALRFFNVYGDGMAQGGYATALRIFLDRLTAGEPIVVTGDGMQERDFTHVTDIVDASVRAATTLIERGTTANGAYNVGSGRPQRMLDVARLFSDEITYASERREPKKTHADFTRARETFGWEPRADFVLEVRRLIDANR